MATFTYRQRLEREAQVKQMVDEGLSIGQIARQLEISQQAVAGFLKVRGWKTKGMLENETAEVRKAERRAERRKINTTVDRSGVKSHKAKTTSKG